MGVVLAVVAGWVVAMPLLALLIGKAMRERPAPPAPAPIPTPVATPPALTPEMVVVTAHGLVQACTVVVGAAHTMQGSWADMSDEQRDDVAGAIVAHATLIQDVLVDLTRGVADDVVLALDSLQRPLRLPDPAPAPAE